MCRRESAYSIRRYENSRSIGGYLSRSVISVRFLVRTGDSMGFWAAHGLRGTARERTR